MCLNCSAESDLSKFTLDLGLIWLNYTSRWAKRPVSLKLKFSVLPRILIHHFKCCKRSCVDWTQSKKNKVKPFVMQGTEWLIAFIQNVTRSSLTQFTHADVPNAATNLYALMLMAAHSFGQESPYALWIFMCQGVKSKFSLQNNLPFLMRIVG